MEAVETLRWIQSPLEIEFSPAEANAEEFELEFDRFAESDDDPLNEWLKLARARGETKESDPVLLALLIDLHRKMDDLIAKVAGEKKAQLELESTEQIDGINYTHFKLKNAALNNGARYYARMNMPVFPARTIGFFFTAANDKVGALSMMHERDQKAWDNYAASRERVLIRKRKMTDE
jgi:hypothetical protein